MPKHLISREDMHPDGIIQPVRVRLDSTTRVGPETFRLHAEYSHTHYILDCRGCAEIDIRPSTGLGQIVSLTPGEPLHIPLSIKSHIDRLFLQSYLFHVRFVIEGVTTMAQINHSIASELDRMGYAVHAEPLLPTLAPEIDYGNQIERERAKERAEGLLRELWGIDAEGAYMPVESSLYPGRVYRVPFHEENVIVVEDDTMLGSLCIDFESVEHIDDLPSLDRAIALKLWIEADESGFLAIANRVTWYGRQSRTWNAIV